MPDSPTSKYESNSVCDCKGPSHSACANEAFYREYEGNRYCVLHLPCQDKSPDFGRAVQQKLDAKDFNFSGVWFPDHSSFEDSNFVTDAVFTKAVFNGLADFRRSVFSAACNFDDAVFNERAAFDEVSFDGPASFHGTKFLGYAGFGRVRFAHQVSFLAAKYPGGANFLHAVFNEQADFHGSKLGGIAFFRASTFSSTVDFKYATFKQANFENTTFADTSDFSECTFESEANYFHANFVGLTNFYSAAFGAASNFRRSHFGALASFDRSTFTGIGYFSNAVFDGEACFTETTFNSSASFSRTDFAGNVDFSYARFNDICGFVGDNKARVFGKDAALNLQHCRIEKSGYLSFHTLTLRPCWFVNLDAREVEFTNVDWHSFKINREIDSLISAGVSSQHRMLAIACRHLAVNAEENNRYEEASNFRYMAMDVRRLERWHGLAFWRLSWWYWLASGYGERMLQAFLVLLGILLLFAFLYTRVGFARWEPKLSSEVDAAVAKRDDVGSPLKFSRALTYSAGVMTLQKPEPRPATAAAQTVVLLETILGPVQAALLALAIRRKFMR